jgi:hypothetical protein
MRENREFWDAILEDPDQARNRSFINWHNSRRSDRIDALMRGNPVLATMMRDPIVGIHAEDPGTSIKETLLIAAMRTYLEAIGTGSNIVDIGPPPPLRDMDLSTDPAHSAFYDQLLALQEQVDEAASARLLQERIFDDGATL